MKTASSWAAKQDRALQTQGVLILLNHLAFRCLEANLLFFLKFWNGQTTRRSFLKKGKEGVCLELMCLTAPNCCLVSWFPSIHRCNKGDSCKRTSLAPCWYFITEELCISSVMSQRKNNINVPLAKHLQTEGNKQALDCLKWIRTDQDTVWFK